MAHSSCILHESKTENRTSGITSWPISERPRERLLTAGPAALSISELLAILIGNGIRGKTALDLARQIVNSRQKLADLALADLVQVEGLGFAKAGRVLAAIELGKRVLGERFSEPTRISNAASVFELMRPRMAGLSVEVFFAISVDVKNRPRAIHEIARGSDEAVLFQPKEVFRDALKLHASGILVVHNHPSGDPTPSPEDERLTARLKEGAELLGLRFLDHVIVTDDGYFSFQEAGIGNDCEK